MRFAARRFPDRLLRRRETPGHRDGLGVWIPGAVIDTELRASVQPIQVDDSENEGGSQFRERLRCFVLPHRSRVAPASAALRLMGADLTLRGARITLNSGLSVTDRHAAAASFVEAGADRCKYLGVWFVVQSSVTWYRYTRAILLLET